MGKNFKDEVDTLNEALKIAAMDIAEVAQTGEDDFLSSGDEDQKSTDSKSAISNREESEDDVYLDASTSKYSSTNKTTSVMRAVMVDSYSAKSASSSTFLIHEDGSFEKK